MLTRVPFKVKIYENNLVPLAESLNQPPKAPRSTHQLWSLLVPGFFPQCHRSSSHELCQRSLLPQNDLKRWQWTCRPKWKSMKISPSDLGWLPTRQINNIFFNWKENWIKWKLADKNRLHTPTGISHSGIIARPNHRVMWGLSNSCYNATRRPPVGWEGLPSDRQRHTRQSLRFISSCWFVRRDAGDREEEEGGVARLRTSIQRRTKQPPQKMEKFHQSWLESSKQGQSKRKSATRIGVGSGVGVVKID